MSGEYGPMLYGPEDRRQHLDFVQQTISRLSVASSNAKGWSITLGGAAFGFAVNQNRAGLAVLGIILLLAFSFVDAYYLYSERLFRLLYEDARHGNAEPFAMNARHYASSHGRVEAYLSWSVAGFYGSLAAIGVLGAIVVAGS